MDRIWPKVGERGEEWGRVGESRESREKSQKTNNNALDT